MLRSLLTSRFARPLAWACLLLVAILSLIPREIEIRTGFAASLEHAFAYACTGIALAAAYPARRWWVIACLLGAFSSLLEVLQTFSPGRHPGLGGALSSTAGALLGTYAGHRLVSRFALPRGEMPSR